MQYFKRIGAIAFASALLIAGTAGPARADDKADVVATVQQFMDGFNKGNVKAVVAACAPTASIIDDFPPHRWVGIGSCQTWFAAYNADAKKNGITGGIVSLQTPWHVDVDGTTAYVVMPANFTYKQNGKSVAEKGSVLTAVLLKIPSGWRIASWAWAER